MVGFLERLFGRDGDNKKSGKLAKDRLQLVLVKDRINLPSEKVQQMEREIIEVISKYVSVDMENVDFSLSNRDRTGLLVAEIPFISVTDEPPDDAADTIDAEDSPEADDDDTIPVPDVPLNETSAVPPNPLTRPADDEPDDLPATEPDDSDDD